MAIKGVRSTGKTRGGASGATALEVYQIKDAYATAIGNGDPVAFGTAGNAGYLILCAESNTPVGILRGVEYFDANGTFTMSRNYPASTTNTGVIDGVYSDVKAYVEPIENRVFQMVTSDTALTQAMIGSTFRLKSVGTVTSGLSQAVVDLDATVGAETLLVRILGLSEVPGNALGLGAVVDVEFVNVVGDA